MATLFYIVQIVLAITLITVILLQVKSASLGSAFGGSDASIYTSRRGIDRVLFQFTIALSIVFLITSLIVLMVAPPAA
ncbi:MAG TPA: preprotein translocase subunit SecG [Chloroflexota bacterium]|jgi:preprotein translocase subunit SecG|nr:preprotein translocase subunit SecG [Chloroflexota bacterium]